MVLLTTRRRQNQALYPIAHTFTQGNYIVIATCLHYSKVNVCVVHLADKIKQYHATADEPKTAQHSGMQSYGSLSLHKSV